MKFHCATVVYCLWIITVNVIGQVANWNVQSCNQLCSTYSELKDSFQLKASNQGKDLSLLEYSGPYPSSYPYDLLVFESLHVEECTVNGPCIAQYSNFLGNLRFAQDDHRFDIRLSRCYSSRNLIFLVQVGELQLGDKEVHVNGCFLSVMINRNPFIHAYLMNLTQPQDTSVNIAQIMLGQYFLCAGQTVQILQQLGYGSRSIAVALATVYNLDHKEFAAVARCAGVFALDTTELLQSVYLDSADAAGIALEYAGFSSGDIVYALQVVYGV